MTRYIRLSESITGAKSVKNKLEIFIKEEVDKALDFALLTEGGLGGHMSHIYENKNLRFSQIKKIFKMEPWNSL